MLSFNGSTYMGKYGRDTAVQSRKPLSELLVARQKYKLYARFGTKTRDNGDSETTLHVQVYPNYMCDMVSQF